MVGCDKVDIVYHIILISVSEKITLCKKLYHILYHILQYYDGWRGYK